MPISGTIRKIENETGRDFSDILIEALNAHHTELRAAAALNVYPNTVRWHRLKFGITRKNGVWVKESK